MSDSEQALLEAITNLAAFHREHEKFYASAPREQAVVLQRHARTLQALADHWSTVEVDRRTPFSPFEGTEDLNSPVATQLEGVLFMEGEGEPPEITHLKRDLTTVAGDYLGIGEWLSQAMDASWGMAEILIDVPELADLLGERHRIIVNDWQAAEMARLAGRLLMRAVTILERIDFSPSALRADLDGARVAPSLLYSAAELVGRAADLASDSAGVERDNERRWRVFRTRVVELLEARAPASR